MSRRALLACSRALGGGLPTPRSCFSGCRLLALVSESPAAQPESVEISALRLGELTREPGLTERLKCPQYRRLLNRQIKRERDAINEGQLVYLELGERRWSVYSAAL
jgi:hypothetical protein